MPINVNEEQLDQCLFDALYALMQTRSIEDLTVGEILSRAHVSRSSFYRHYRDKYDLLTQSYEHILQSTYLRCVSGASWKESTAARWRSTRASSATPCPHPAPTACGSISATSA